MKIGAGSWTSLLELVDFVRQAMGTAQVGLGEGLTLGVVPGAFRRLRAGRDKPAVGTLRIKLAPRV